MPASAPAVTGWPGSRTDHVPRTALCERLAEAGAAQVVLVRAPAGFGKTTALQQLQSRLMQQGLDCVWLTLERADNDAPRLLARLARALGAADPAPGDGRACAPSADPAELLARRAGRVALFLDDLEQLQEPAALALLRRLMARLPRGARLLLGSRSQPAQDLGLDLGLLRRQGLLAEIDTDELRFSLADTADFLRLRGLQALPAAAVAELQRKTEGWVAALWLASLALERHGPHSDFIARFSGTERAVAEYLAEEVLAQQSPALQEFLLRTSLVRELSLPLAEALNPRLDCQAALQQLAADSIFLSPLPGAADQAPAWRYHSLFADFLQARLAQQRPDDVARLHLIAAAWYEQQGRPVPAIDHLIDGGDHPQALLLLQAHAEGFLARGRMRLLQRWFGALPAAALQGRPRLQVLAAWAACFTQGPWQAWHWLEQVQQQLDGPAGDDALLQGHAGSLRPLLLSMMDRFDEAYACGRDGLARLPSPTPFADRALVNTLASVAAAMGEQLEARRLLEAARHGPQASRFEHSFTQGMQALLDLQDGRLREADAGFRIALAPAGGGQDSANAWIGVLQASLLYEWGRLDRAAELLDIHLPLARDIGLPDHMILSHALAARIAAQQGDMGGAFQALAELEDLGHRRHLPRVAAAAKVERARLLCLLGQAEVARDELDRSDDAALWSRVQRLRLPAHDCSDLALGRLRWQLHFGDAQAALQALAAERQRCGTSRPRRALLLQVLTALAQQRTGDEPAALATLADWLRAATPQGFVRLLLDEGQAAAALLHGLQRQLDDGAAPAAGPLDDPLLRDHLQHLIEAAGPAAAAAAAALAARAASAAPVAPVLEQPLTRKEIRVLELLVEGHSNSAMASRLFVSDSTIRTHLRNINQKTGARNRTQAVAIARRLGVLR